MKQPLVRRHIARPFALMICFLLLLLVIAPGLLAQKAVWPNCNFNCTAKDVVLIRAYAEITGAGCAEGAPVTATIWGVFNASVARYAVWMIGDIYANGTLIQRIEECVIDSISPGTTEVPLAVVTWPCGAPLELENMVVSWAARAASCMDEPGCQERGAKCSRPLLTPIYVYPNLVIDFTANEPQCPGAPVTFTAIVTGGAAPYSYDWDFGDGSGTSVQENPQYSYPDAGSYTVQLTVSDGSGQREMQTKLIMILNPPSVFADNGGPYCEGEIIELSASGGSTYTWAGPGGFISTDQNPVIPNATIGDAGTYTVHVSDLSGCVAEASTDVVVNACQRTLTIASTNGGSVSAPGEGSFTYTAGTEVLLEAANDPCHVFSRWVGDVDELADPGAASTVITLERDTLLEARFLFYDTEPPPLDCPPDVIVECGDEITPELLGMATALDTCDPSPIVTYVDDETAGACPGEMTIARTWTATDTAGNSAECVQTIEVRDTTAPTLSLSNKTFECNGAGNVDDIAGWLADPIGADDCSEVVISNNYGGLSGACPGTGAALVTFTATDACRNSTERTATVTIIDTTPPNAGDDAAATFEDTPATIPVLENDEDTCSKSLDIVSVGTSLLGNAEISGNQIRYTPQIDAAGTDSFTYTVEDCNGNRDTALVEITVTPVDDPPVARDQSRTTDEDTATGFFSLAVSDPDNALADLSCDCVNPPAHGTVERGMNHTVNYRPDSDFAGIDTFSYEVCDPEGLCDTATVTVTVTSENDNPSIEATDQTTQEDTPVSISVTHSDPDGDPLTCVVLDPTHGTVTPASATITGPYPQSGELVYTPDLEFNGTDNFTITCDDGKGGAATALVEITVTPVNDPPVAQDQVRTTAEDTATGFFSLAVSDPDDTLADLSCDCVNPPAHGTVERGADHTVNYTPDPNFAGIDTFNYKVCDPEGLCDTALVEITVTPVSDPPYAHDDDATTREETEVSIDVAANDSDADGDLDLSTIVVTVGPTHGTATVDPATGVISYLPSTDFHGTDTLTYEICDVNGACDTATVTIAVTPVNDPPTATGQGITTDEDTPVEIVLAGDDVDGDALDYSILSEPSHGEIQGFDPATDELIYRPDSDFNGQDSFIFEVCDPFGACSTATIKITVTPVNDPPVAEAAEVQLAEDTLAAFTLTGSDIDQDPLRYTLLTDPTHGEITGFDPATGDVIYTPDPNYNGEDTLTYDVCDTSGACDSATVKLVITPVNDLPQAAPQALVTDEDTELSITLAGTDPDGDPLQFTIVSNPAHGTVSGLDPETGELLYTPNPEYDGDDAFIYQVCDDNECVRATIRITVTPVDDPPVARDQSRTTGEDTATGFFSLAVSDPDNALADLSCDCVNPPAHGTVERGANHTVNYTPDSDFAGIDTFSYEVCDPDGLCDTATVTVTVTSENDNPSIEATDQTTQEDTPVSISVTHSDPDGDPLTCVVLDPTHGTVTPASATITGPYPQSGKLVYTPDPEFNGTDNFTITCDDGKGGAATALVEITVTPVNDPPVAEAAEVQLAEDTPAAFTLTGNDIDNDPLRYAFLTGPIHGEITDFDPSTGDVIYTPNPDYNGEDTLTYEVCDTSGACSTATIKITVTPVNDPPQAAPQALVTNEDTELSITLAGTDPDGDPLQFAIVSDPGHGTVSGLDPETGELVYTPNPEYAGIDSVVYTVCDPFDACDTAQVTILVAPTNDPPVAISTDTIVSAGWMVPVAVNGTDPDGDRITYEIVEGPSHGILVNFNPDTGQLIYLSDIGYIGPDAVRFRVCDPHGACDEGLLQLFVVDGGGGGGTATAKERTIAISEIAWAGTNVDARDEWIELANLSSEEINLAGWTLRWRKKIPQSDEDVQWKAIALQGVIEPASTTAQAETSITETAPGSGIWQVIFPLGRGNGFYLIEHETNQAVSNIPADMVYEDRLSPTGTLDLADVGDVIELLDRYGTLVDTANTDNPERDGWAAGSASTRGTMERTNLSADDLDWNWHTNLGVITSGEDAHGNQLLGTARTENSPILEDLLSAWEYRSIELYIGNTLRISIPITAAEARSDAQVMAFVSRPGAEVESAPIEIPIQMDQQLDGMNIAISTDSFWAGEAHIWIAYVDGPVFLVPVLLK